ncbi:MAG: hypothetical protein C4527_23680 [Candidatus Omnitrophota bacterium]|jgi:hypothetical protein|nr:MAG: hypothetical protein C4527_23680 [Candidatus Omnitrophota bacterium]
MRKNFSFFYLFMGLSLAFGCNHRVPSTPPVADQEDFTRQVSVPSNIRIVEINHENGDLIVKGWEQPFILLEGTKKVVAKSVGDARYALQEIQIVAYETPPNRLVLNYQDTGSGARKNTVDERITYTANIPRELALDIKLRHASITVEQVANHVSIDHRFGDVKADAINGKLQIRSQGGVVGVHNAQKSVKIDSRECDLHIDRVGGDVAIQHQWGEIELSNVNGTAILNCQNSQIALKDIHGRLEIDNRRGDVVCDGFREGIRAYVLHGTLKLAPQVPVPQSYYCDVDNGNIILRVPEESSMLLDVRAEQGRIHSDFPMNVGAEGGVSYGKGVNNEGRFEVRLRVRNGSATILRSIQLPTVDSGKMETQPEILSSSDSIVNSASSNPTFSETSLN